MSELSPAEILSRYHGAMRAKAPDQLADLYAEDAVHELPFDHTPDGILRGRAAVRARYAAAWSVAPVEVRDITNVKLHQTVEPDLVVAEQDLELTNTTNGHHFVAATVLVMRVRNGEIVHMRDYTDNLTIATELGRMPLGAEG
ncbi:MAG TPA: nuclear transport factor 2 family protein [Devosia sp.]|nr:nuclear transport factor 2 family protein [Devosia sp.]